METSETLAEARKQRGIEARKKKVAAEKAARAERAAAQASQTPGAGPSRLGQDAPMGNYSCFMLLLPY